MYLKEIIDTNEDIEFKRICFNSKDIKKGDLFIPYGGIDRYKYISDALKKGCSLVITDKNYINKKVFKINNLDKEIILILNKYYNYPLKNIKLIGVTGTDGKTTIATTLSNLLKCPSIGTNGFVLGNKNYHLNNTTPSIDVLYDCFNKSCNLNYKNIVMEVSSEAYLTKRIGKLPFDIAIFTNITKDHLDKHKTFSNYLECKLQLFKNSKISILNRDSKYYYKFKDNSRISYSYGFKRGSDLRILYYKLFIDKSLICFKYQGRIYKLYYNLLGKFNVYNVASIILTMIKLGYKIDEIFERFSYIKPVSGRMEIFKINNKTIVLDYAHTTNATLNVLKFFYKFNKNIITVVGCAGNRYKDKRKEIGFIVLKYSKLVIFTMDDPRNENPNNIIDEMTCNYKRDNYLKIIDREKAIKYAIENSNKFDLILILGKGRDNYMLINNKKIKYSDYDTIINILKK